MNTIIISAFPGTGKTYLTSHNDTGLVISDSDSSKFSKDKFPANYIEHIKKRIGYVDIILVSSHKEVRQALVDAGLWFTLIYPTRESKIEFLNRYRERKNTYSFVELLYEHWDMWLDELETQEKCTKILLPSNLYVKDAVLALVNKFKQNKDET